MKKILMIFLCSLIFYSCQPSVTENDSNQEADLENQSNTTVDDDTDIDNNSPTPADIDTDVETRQPFDLLDEFNFVVHSVSWSPDSSRLAAGGIDNNIIIIDLVSGDITTFEGHQFWVHSVSWSPDGTKIASGGEDETVRIWDVQTGNQTAELVGHRNTVNSVAWSPDGTKLATAGGITVRIWDSISYYELLVFEGTTERSYYDDFNCVAWSPDGTKLAAGNEDNTVRIWHVASGTQTLEYYADSFVHSLAWSPDGSTLAAGVFVNTVRLVEPTSGNDNWLVIEPNDEASAVYGIAWSPRGTLLATGGADQTIRIWQNLSQIFMETVNDSVFSVAWAPDGSMLAAGGHFGIKIWRISP